MDLGLKGKRALVLGATRGLGRGIAEALAGEGALVALTGRKQDDAVKAASEVASSTGATVHGLPFDAADPASPGAVIAAAKSALGDVDILVLNAGGPPPGPITSVDLTTWQKQFQAQFLSFIEVANAFVPAMREHRWGRVLVSSSSGVEMPIPNLGISNSLRSSLLGWAKTLATEVAADGVTVNTLLPGRIQTDRIEQIDNDTAQRTGRPLQEVKAASLSAIPAGRLGTTEEYGAIAAFILSEKAAYMTGGTFRVDGGMVRNV